jgi:hypothetical protein
LTPQQPTQSAHGDGPELSGHLATDWEATADLTFENTTDLAPTPENKAFDATCPVALGSEAPQQIETILAKESGSSPVLDARMTEAPRRHNLPPAPVPQQRTLGFFAFAACTLIAVLGTTQRPTGSSSLRTEAALAATGPADETQLGRTGSNLISVEPRAMRKPVEPLVAKDVDPKRRRAGAGESLGVVAFESRSSVTSEQATAAVFILKRTQVVRGKARVHWAARSGSADAGIDFSDASGTVRFADGQRQVAIYVPLRNDLLKEEDESFKVCLRSPEQTRIGGRSCAEVTVIDDDDLGPT